MTADDSGGIRFIDGRESATRQVVHSTPLGYSRELLQVGEALPIPGAGELVDRLDAQTSVTVALNGSLGDSLLALSAVRAVLEWLRLRHPSRTIPVAAEGRHAALIRRAVPSGAVEPAPGSTVLVADRPTVEQRASGFVPIVCDPAAPPCWASSWRVHADLPARYYLTLERRLGVRLPADRDFGPLLFAPEPSANPTVRALQADDWFTGPVIAVITATSWPERKDYTVARYLQVAERVAELSAMDVKLLVVGGHAPSPEVSRIDSTGPRVRALRLDGIPATDLADVFPLCDLVIGNDTGLTHLAALSRRPNGEGPAVLGLYARHSHSKWTTGLAHHHAVATEFSQRMHQGDLCPVRDAINSPSGNDLATINPEYLAALAIDLLHGNDHLGGTT
ncbi:glycosyltransferase family 9 protein [Streptomyces sp. NPDC056401]|uniref:glycosyltransferase family 9 protein n=1 Tax=Streptomyces sp. NPDC056401 TaxID=3345809 RepID=UPI0035DAF687